MKKSISLFPIVLYFVLLTKISTAQVSIPFDPSILCNQCNVTNDTVHDISIDKAAKMIKKFKHKFKTETYGGTVYGNLNYFDTISDKSAANGKLLRFHFCSDSTVSRFLFLAFEKDTCYVSSDNLNYYINTAKPAGDCIRSNEQVFDKIAPKFIISLRKFKTRLNKYDKPHSLVFNNKESQYISAGVVNKCRDNLNNNNYFNDHIPSQFKGGNFDFKYSIAEIFKDAKCAGIRYYFGCEKDKNTCLKNNDVVDVIKVLIVGVDDNGDNLSVWKENSLPH